MLRFIKDHNQKGQLAENLALKYLQKQGLTRLQENFSCKHGEIDLIMFDNEFIVFIEVRYRKKTQFGHPLETINDAKQKKILKAVQYFLIKHPEFNHLACRIDAVALYSQDQSREEQIDWIQNAIQA
ncbi:MAG: YraN family protein [gamma proteobacterium symbiont of Bathyaustriella thionipta]|nr:YraN family protein [gamma proteobacterium symbiont of Bathyaustriella thionipta]MCU7948405.1 YraN family protein [gamma proteobacterium symbiont of Bathyaustriella thionipta]MCU7954104.1 YraN family protein [gamma proteobacterium symbiont of Bathyaustriella thionipta]MCU7955397.1 YraN family protein [gamma proteobacterium symbiont of Bathyaustriella thionipta]MCU7966768.1 YraN family protein [gamma proteobacterium symbiont of Bathyaustriella thionipta]